MRITLADNEICDEKSKYENLIINEDKQYIHAIHLN